jgi:molybdenum cofactor cytidylyltransferase
VQTIPHDTLSGALGLGHRELVALVGGGGKTGALCLLAGELAGTGARVIATTTTAMRLRELAALGPMVMETSEAAAAVGLERALSGKAIAGVAYSPGDEGKVVGLPVDWVDRLWRRGLADHILVEADGSRGRSLKVFGSDEPQVPSETTTIVHVAGLDAIGRALTDENVHRVASAVTALGVPLGAPLTEREFVGCLQEQVRVLRRRWGAARIVTLLNKAESVGGLARGLETAGGLLASPWAPDSVVVGSLREGRFVGVSQPSVCAIVLAAGCASRMGEQKVLLTLGGRFLVERAVDAALGSKAGRTIVVVGHEADRVAQVLKGRPVTVAVNPDYELGMSTSLRAGLRAAGPGWDAAVFLLGDQPFVTSAVVDALIDRFAQTGMPITRPLSEGRPAHPVLMGSALFPEILAQVGDVGGREIVDRHPEEVCLVPMDDPRVVVDIDSGEDYEAALLSQDGSTSLLKGRICRRRNSTRRWPR